MKQPSCVVWALTRRFNSSLVKFQGNSWSHAPTNMTGFHNASQSASTLGVSVEREPTKKSFRRNFTLTLTHKPHHLRGARKAKSQSKQGYSKVTVRKDVHRTAKAIKGLTFQNDRTKTLALRRLQRLANGSRTLARGEAKPADK